MIRKKLTADWLKKQVTIGFNSMVNTSKYVGLDKLETTGEL